MFGFVFHYYDGRDGCERTSGAKNFFNSSTWCRRVYRVPQKSFCQENGTTRIRLRQGFGGQESSLPPLVSLSLTNLWHPRPHRFSQGSHKARPGNSRSPASISTRILPALHGRIKNNRTRCVGRVRCGGRNRCGSWSRSSIVDPRAAAERRLAGRRAAGRRGRVRRGVHPDHPCRAGGFHPE